MEEFLFFVVFDTLFSGCYLRMLPDGSRIHAFRSASDAFDEFSVIGRIISNKEYRYGSYVQLLGETHPYVIKIPNKPELIRYLINNNTQDQVKLDSGEITLDFPVIKISKEALEFKVIDICGDIFEMAIMNDFTYPEIRKEIFKKQIVEKFDEVIKIIFKNNKLVNDDPIHGIILLEGIRKAKEQFKIIFKESQTALCMTETDINKTIDELSVKLADKYLEWN